MTDWAGMQSTVTAALDAAVGAGVAHLIVGDNSIAAGKLLRNSRTVRERAEAERWAIGEISDCIAAWKRARGWAGTPATLGVDAPPLPDSLRQGRLL